jgi:hypothetical protein
MQYDPNKFYLYTEELHDHDNTMTELTKEQFEVLKEYRRDLEECNFVPEEVDDIIEAVEEKAEWDMRPSEFDAFFEDDIDNVITRRIC